VDIRIDKRWDGTDDVVGMDDTLTGFMALADRSGMIVSLQLDQNIYIGDVKGRDGTDNVATKDGKSICLMDREVGEVQLLPWIR
jgi:hypothetical protein